MAKAQRGEGSVYQSEFPVDQPIPIFDPTLLLAILLAILVIAGIAFAVGRQWGRKDKNERFRETPKIIHEAIRAKCVAATSATSGELEKKASELVEEIMGRIGPVVAFGGPCAKALKGLTEALKGEPPAEEHGKGHGHAPAHGHGQGHGAGKGGHAPDSPTGHDPSCRCDRCVAVLVEAAAPGFAILGPRMGDQTVLIANPAKAADDHHDAHEEPKVLGHKDFSMQVRMAVVAFSDFWNRGDCIQELERCRDALVDTKPLPKLKLPIEY